MKRILKVGGLLLLTCLILALITLRAVGLDPRDRAPGYSGRPGLWLSGELVTTPVTDWSFSDQFPTICIQTRSWYLIPHSVITNCVAHNGQLYVTSSYGATGEFPRDKLWNRSVMRDPRVRLKIGNQLFDQRLSLVTDPTEKREVLQSKAKKYPDLKPAPKVYVFHVLPR
ncbi:MAG: hypothetical protein HY315_08285 [Acidobacteria bacterium]|nr:hypothetical protein [Acidobacteriota bacterium]